MYDYQKNIHIIDFGSSSRYITKAGDHIEEGVAKMFRGNLQLASANQLSYKLTSRRDDLITLCYLLVYLLNDQLLFQIEQNFSVKEGMKAMLELK